MADDPFKPIPVSLKVKRIYAPAAPEDGARILVDRLWPRGISKARAALTAWVRQVAPSDDLRHWFGHDPERWNEFQRRYDAELDANPVDVSALRAALGQGAATLLFAAHDEAHNNAVALAAYLRRHD